MVRTIGDDASECNVIDNIAKYGWQCMNISAEGELPCFSYTIGNFHSNKGPEFIIFGLRAETCHKVLSLTVDGLKTGTIFDLALPTSELLNGYACVFVEVPRSRYREHVEFCRWYYQGNDFPLYQIVWPSKDGNFPWHADASEAFRATQPVLGFGDNGA